ncbi:primosomal protein N' [Frankia sp. Cas3]|uniref:primosomal protein N' n=1 Tax=Frankia sp. Cas3 TaxID=3073926 RepID=UPI002AD506EF|nr:primosomal protein N' [Frankia sp. Cas3]
MPERSDACAGLDAPAGASRPPTGAGSARRPARSTGLGAPEPAGDLPVARVAVDVSPAHLDRLFDYLVPAQWAQAAVPGARVRVRFAGRLVDGFILSRCERSDHTGTLAFLTRVVSPEPILAPEIAELARAVADRYAGTLTDVLRLAVPPRHARVEKEPPPAADLPAADLPAADLPAADPPAADPPAGAWSQYPQGERLLGDLATGGSPRAVWWALPGPSWPAMVTAAVAATVRSDRGALVVVPDHRDIDRVVTAMRDVPGAAGCVALRADLGPAERYRRFLAVSRGTARVVVGTRAAVFAPVRDLGLIIVWDDGDDLHAEPRSPYPHTRDVAVLRSRQQRSGLIIGGWSPSADAQALVRVGWAGVLAPPRSVVRAAAARVEATGSDFEAARDPAARAARLPSLAWRAAHDALAAGTPVLVQVPRRGYQLSLACTGCRRPARCGHCQGSLGRPSGTGPPTCNWCGRPALDLASRPPAGAAGWRCPSCGDTRLRATVVGDRRTAEELGRAFPGVAVRTSGRDGVLASVPATPALVVATPGAEPLADGGYGAVLLLDTWALLGRADLRAAEETLRRWCAAAALARPASDGGRIVVTADVGLAVVQALTRWDPGWFIRREQDERAALGFPPATRIAAVEGAAGPVAELIAAAELPAGADVLGPVPLETWGLRPPAMPPNHDRIAGGPLDEVGRPAGRAGAGQSAAGEERRERVLVRVPRARGQQLAVALKAARGVLDARRSAPVRVILDPITLL